MCTGSGRRTDRREGKGLPLAAVADCATSMAGRARRGPGTIGCFPLSIWDGDIEPYRPRHVRGDLPTEPRMHRQPPLVSPRKSCGSMQVLVLGGVLLPAASSLASREEPWRSALTVVRFGERRSPAPRSRCRSRRPNGSRLLFAQIVCDEASTEVSRSDPHRRDRARSRASSRGDHRSPSQAGEMGVVGQQVAAPRGAWPRPACSPDAEGAKATSCTGDQSGANNVAISTKSGGI